MPQTADLITLIQSRMPLVVIESREELQVIDLFKRTATTVHLPLYQWTITAGLTRVDVQDPKHGSRMDPGEVLQHIWSMKLAGIYLLLDFHPYLDDPRHVRLIKENAQLASRHRQTLVFLSHEVKLPGELTHLAARFDLKLPDEAQLEEIVTQVALQWSQIRNQQKVQVNREAFALLIKNLKGLSPTEAERLARTAIYDDGAITPDDLPEIAKAKYALLNQDGVLSFEYNTALFSDVGGLRKFKQWLQQRQAVFVGKDREVGLDLPKGLLLLGVQGGGKSLAAKAVAGTWQVPLLRLDFGALYNRYLGETERRTREALKLAETMAPCVLWLDEIEKGLATDEADSGTSRRLLGTLLTWMAEHTAAVFIVATANDINILPPELLRKGRLDEIFFVDLPDDETRKEIFTIHLRKRCLTPEAFDLDALAQGSVGFSGAEIEQAIVSGLYAVLGTSGVLSSDELLAEIQATRPLSVVMAEHIAYLRSWAEGRTVSAH